MKKCVFFDRDGVVNVSPGPGYVERWADFHIFPEFVDVLRTVSTLGFCSVIVTNQSCIAKGIVAADTVQDMHRRLCGVLEREHGLALLDIFMCPHNPGQCDCRKPKPGMLLEAGRKHGLDLAASWMIGDSPRDIEAGAAAGCRTILVGSKVSATPPSVRVRDMADLKSRIAEIVTM